MKIFKLIEAREPLNNLLNARYNNFAIVRKLVQLRKQIETEIEFYASEEKKLIELYASKNSEGKPVVNETQIQFDSLNNKLAFEKEILKLRDVEVNEFEVVNIALSDFKTQDFLPTPNEVVILEGIVEFKEE